MLLIIILYLLLWLALEVVRQIYYGALFSSQFKICCYYKQGFDAGCLMITLMPFSIIPLNVILLKIHPCDQDPTSVKTLIVATTKIPNQTHKHSLSSMFLRVSQENVNVMEFIKKYDECSVSNGTYKQLIRVSKTIASSNTRPQWGKCGNAAVRAYQASCSMECAQC